MNTVPICDSSITVSRLGLGCSRFGSLRGVGMRRAQALLRRAFDLGVTLFDTANVYGQGDSERIIGRTLRRHRDDIVVVTKAGYPMPPMNLAKRFAKPILRPIARARDRERPPLVQPTPSRNDDKRFVVGDLRSSLEGSLRRLQTDYVDIFMLHSLPPTLLGDDDLLAFLAGIKKEGKARAVGYSMIRFPQGLAARVDDRIDVVGSAVNRASPDNLEELRGLAERDIPVLGYQVFASGALIEGDLGPGHHLDFALRQPGVASVVAGASSVRQLEQNVRTVEALTS